MEEEEEEVTMAAEIETLVSNLPEATKIITGDEAVGPVGMEIFEEVTMTTEIKIG